MFLFDIGPNGFMDGDYFIVDVETCPIEMEGYFELSEAEKNKLMNPIDSKIVAIGIRHDDRNQIFMDESEKKILDDFWLAWKTIKKGDPSVKVVGFNILDYDLPFITTRSFINDVVISPFTIKLVIDLRQKLSAYRSGRVRGTLKELSELIGGEKAEEDGSMVAKWCSENNMDKLKEYLSKDLEKTDALYKRALKTNVLLIERW